MRIEMEGCWSHRDRMGNLKTLISSRHSFIALVAMGLGGCASAPIESFNNTRPLLDPEKYFAGKTHSWAMVETPSGEPKETLTTRTVGHLDGTTLHFEQDIVFAHGRTEHRSWLVRRLDAHDYSATGTGIIGTAHGVAYGNMFHLDFALDAVPGNPLAHVHMSQWMYLQTDGVTLMNRDTVTKGGVILAEASEVFWKDR
jgi:hypothetical protein